MDNVMEFLPIDQQQNKIDTLSAVHRNKVEVVTVVQAMSMENGLVEGFVERMSEKKELKEVNFSHPFGHYEIPVVVTDLFPSLRIPCQVKVVPGNHTAFTDRDDPNATYDPHNDIVYLRENDFTLVGRLLGWVGLGRKPEIMNEELVEHEVRHALFEKSLKGPLGGGIGNINEGFARATHFAPFLDDSGKAFEKYWTYQAYEKYYMKPKEIAEYVELFKVIQASGVDEVDVLRFMEENEWWANRFNVWNLDSGRLRANVIKHIGNKEIERLADLEHTKRRDELLNFRYGVWSMLLEYLEENGCAPRVNWDDAVREEKGVREGWDQYRREKNQI